MLQSMRDILLVQNAEYSVVLRVVLSNDIITAARNFD